PSPRLGTEVAHVLIIPHAFAHVSVHSQHTAVRVLAWMHKSPDGSQAAARHDVGHAVGLGDRQTGLRCQRIVSAAVLLVTSGSVTPAGGATVTVLVSVPVAFGSIVTMSVMPILSPWPGAAAPRADPRGGASEYSERRYGAEARMADELTFRDEAAAEYDRAF